MPHVNNNGDEWDVHGAARAQEIGDYRGRWRAWPSRRREHMAATAGRGRSLELEGIGRRSSKRVREDKVGLSRELNFFFLSNGKFDRDFGGWTEHLPGLENH